jgi:hypothetical protein
MGQRSEYCIQDAIKSLADVFSEESQDEVAAFLEQRVLAPIATVCLHVRKVLWSVQFDHKVGVGTEKINLHVPALIKVNWQLLVQPKPTACCR